MSDTSQTAPVIQTRGLDHVHLYVHDRPAALDWYGRILGLVPFGKWRNDDPAPDHPVFLAPKNTPDHCVSIFTGDRPEGGDRTVAFHATASQFVAFANALPRDDIKAIGGDTLRPAGFHDYGLAMTFNFLDPAGNHLELVTYDCEAARGALAP